MDGGIARHGAYLAYMLRLWQAGSRDGLPVWHASLEHPHTGERLAFGDTKALFEFLIEQTNGMTAAASTADLAGPTGADNGTNPDATGGASCA